MFVRAPDADPASRLDNLIFVAGSPLRRLSAGVSAIGVWRIAFWRAELAVGSA